MVSNQRLLYNMKYCDIFLYKIWKNICIIAFLYLVNIVNLIVINMFIYVEYLIFYIYFKIFTII